MVLRHRVLQDHLKEDHDYIMLYIWFFGGAFFMIGISFLPRGNIVDMKVDGAGRRQGSQRLRRIWAGLKRQCSPAKVRGSGQPRSEKLTKN